MSKIKRVVEEYETLKDMISSHFMTIALNIFVWENLPKGVESYIIEKYLYKNGKVLFFFDDMLSYLTLPVAQQHEFNVYGIQTNYRAFGFNYNTERNIDNSVLIKNNFTLIPTRLLVDYYCGKLANLEMATDVNINANKTPFVFSGNEKALLSMRNVYEQITGNKSVIYETKMATESDMNLTAVNTGVPFIADKLQDMYKTYENKILSYLGIDNIAVDKAERLVTSEADSNGEYINSNIERQYMARVDSAKRINEMYGLDIIVKFNPDIKIKGGVIDDPRLA